MDANSLALMRDRRRTRRRAFALVVFAVLLEVVLLMPFVDHLADSNNTIHFTQHGFIFAGGVLMGLALRDVQRASRR
jgi:peptidoglycan/LPS O-acetylase OafA/YrhL